jgi:hypothetical protein
LREGFKRAEEEKQKKQQDKLDIEGRELVNKFATSFSTLYSLLIGSNIRVEADKTAVHSRILLTCNEKQVSIVLDRAIGKINSWSLSDKAYKATMPNKDFGMAADREDEHRLIISIDELLFNSKLIPEEQLFQPLQASDSVY